MLCRACFLLLCSFLISNSLLAQIDKKATLQTQNLYKNLKRLSSKGVMFGHQDDLSYGITPDNNRWFSEPNRSDVKSVCGEYPAVMGWDLGRIEFDSLRNLDSVSFTEMAQWIKLAYNKGCINTISWHLNNPTSPQKTSWDKADNTIKKILTNKKYKKEYDTWLTKVASFLKNLKSDDGILIPVIYRPFHEHTGNWFWWGAGQSTPDDYKKIWQYTVGFFQKQGVHNLLYAYSTDVFNSKEEYLERYPGDNFVDILGFDCYHRNAPLSNEVYLKNTRRMIETLKAIGTEKGKIWAMTETGLESVTMENWWTNILLPLIKDAGLSYVLVWRNGRPDHYFAPYPGQISAENFKEFTQKDGVILEKKLASEKIYNSPH
jgi:mannan endo-1,4-beta-mannosidase